MGRVVRRGILAASLVASSANALAAPHPRFVQVTVPRANVRSAPNSEAPVAASVPAGTVLEVSRAEGDWYAVSWTPAGQDKRREGFIAARLVAPHTPTAAAPEPAAPPAPPVAAVPPEPPAPRADTPLRVVGGAAAPANATNGQGDKEVLAFANISGFVGGEGGSSASGFIYFNYGKFLNARNEVGGGPSILLSSGGGTSVNLGFNLFYRRYFQTKEGKWHPYAGADLFVSDLSPGTDVPDEFQGFGIEIEQPGVLDVTFFQLLGGAKNYITENLALDLKGTIGFALGDIGGQKIVQGTIGFSYVF
jgi:SH3 domain-containing protein